LMTEPPLLLEDDTVEGSPLTCWVDIIYSCVFCYWSIFRYTL